MTVRQIFEQLVDRGSNDDRRIFARLAVAELFRASLSSTGVPAVFTLPMSFGNGSALAIPVRPKIENAAAIAPFARIFLRLSRDDPAFEVVPAQLVDAIDRTDVPEPSLDDGGPGLLVLIENRPALAIGIERKGDGLYLRMEGFERSVLGMRDELPGLWDDVRRANGGQPPRRRPQRPEPAPPKGPVSESQRRRLAEARRRRLSQDSHGRRLAVKLGLSLPAITLRAATRPVVIDPAAPETAASPGGGFPVLAPIRGIKPGTGGHPMRAALNSLLAAFAVETLVADHQLRCLLGSREAADLELQEVTESSIRHLCRIGRRHLARRTAFDTEAALAAWAAERHADITTVRRDVATERDQRCAAATLPVNLLSKAYEHAQRIADAFDESEAEPATALVRTLEHDFRESPFTKLSHRDLVEIAALADFNPASVWANVPIRLPILFEAARFAGRVRAGIRTELPAPVAAFLGPTLADGARASWSEPLANVWAMIDAVVAHDDFVEALRCVRNGDQVLIERGTRQIVIEQRHGQ